MAAVSEFISYVYTMTIIFFSLLLLEIVIFLRTLTRSLSATKRRLVTTSQFLKSLEEKNPTISYTKNHHHHNSRISAVECAVCLSDFEDGEKVRRLKCKHTFHRECLDRWLQQFMATCPLCRTKVLPDDVVANFHLHSNNINNYHHHHQVDHFYDGSDEEMIFLFSALHGHTLHRFF